MKITHKRDLYNEVVTMSQIGSWCLAECLEYIKQYCGSIVWSEIETTAQVLPKYAKFVDTFYNINVYFDAVTESFLFEEFN